MMIASGAIALTSECQAANLTITSSHAHDGWPAVTYSFGTNIGGNDPNGQKTMDSPLPYGSYIKQENFTLVNDQQFLEMATAKNWSGNGSMNNPFIIQGYEFILPTGTSAMRIRDVSYHFMIRDCLVRSDEGRNFDVAVYLINIDGAAIDNLIVRDSKAAIAISDSTNITIRGCDIDRTGGAPPMVLTNSSSIIIDGNTLVGGVFSVFMDDTKDIAIRNNNISFSEFFALEFSSGEGMIISNNTCWGTALLFSYDRSLLDSVNLTNDNKVNGMPLLFLRDVDLKGGAITTGCGLYILCNVSHASLAGVQFGFSNYAILLIDCHNIVISDVTLSASKIPIAISESENITVEKTTLSAGTYGIGIYLNGCHNCKILTSKVSYFAEGIGLDGSDGCLMQDNNLTNDLLGIAVHPGSNSNRIVGNTFFKNLLLAVLVSGDDNIIIANNFIENAFISSTSDDSWTPQAGDNGTGNQWYTVGAPQGYGNYWSGFGGPKRGEIYQDPVPIIRTPKDRSISNNDTCGLVNISSTPSAPVGVGCLLKGSSAMISWSAPNATGGSRISEYVVCRASSSTGWTEIARTSALNYLDNTTVSGRAYIYKVSAVNLLGEGRATNEIIVPVPSPVDQTNNWVIAIMAIAMIIVSLLAAIVWRFK